MFDANESMESHQQSYLLGHLLIAKEDITEEVKLMTKYLIT
jgi:hypothetical protein